MAIVKIKDKEYFKKHGKKISYYVEDWIKEGFDEKIIPDLKKKDKDCVIAIDGAEGCQPAGEKVMMADGSWKNVEDVVVGDEVLSPQKDGSYVYSKVKKLFKFKSNDIYDIYEKNRDKKKLYSCSSNHLVPMNVKNRKTKIWSIKNYESEDLYEKSKTFFKDSTTPTMFPVDKFKGRKNCKIEPYTLGVWLGDGHFSSSLKYKKNPNYGKKSVVNSYSRKLKSGKIVTHPSYIANHKKKEYLRNYSRDIGITTESPKIIEYIKKFYPTINFYGKEGTNAKLYRFSINSKFSKLMIEYGFEGIGSGEKFIPKDSLMSDLEYRKKLLAGIIDSDGYCSKGYSYSIVTKSKRFSKDIEFLIHSLGGRCRISKIKKRIKSSGFEGEYYKVSFYLGDLDIPLILENKKRDNDFFYLSANRKSIEIKKKKGDFVYGFQLNSPSSLYITSNYVVTHNSGKSTLGLQWCRYIDPTFNLKRVVFTPEEFRNTIHQAKKGQAIMFDEAFTGFSSRAALSGVNKTLISLMMQIRQKNLFIVIVLPTIFLLDKYISLFRTRFLAHVYENKGRRGFFRMYSKKKKRLLIMDKASRTYSYGIRTNKKGRFYGVFALGDNEVEKKYREKKIKALESSEKSPMKSSTVKYREQRNLMLWILRKELKISYRKIENLLNDYDFDVSYRQIASICSKYGDKEDKEGESEEKEGKKSKK